MPIRLKLPLVAAVVALFCLGCSAAAGAAVTVANTNDSGSGSLRDAIEKAPAGETINLPAGNYALTSEALIVERSLTIAGAGSGSTTIRSAGAHRVFEMEPKSGTSAIDVTLSGLTIRGGRIGEESEGEGVGGGGIIAFGVNLTMRDVLLTENVALAQAGEEGGEANGGGMFMLGGTLTTQNTRVTGNTVEANGGEEEGGGRAEGAGAFLYGVKLAIESSTFSGNTAKGNGSRNPGGGGSDEGGAAAGGGLAVISGEGASTVTGSTFSGNVVSAGKAQDGSTGEAGAGGVELAVGEIGKGETLTATDLTVANNVAAAPGGISTGGGALLAAVNGGALKATGATIAGNKIESAGGKTGEGLEDGGGNLSVVDVFPKVFAPGSVSIGGTIVAGGSSQTGNANCHTTGTVTSLGYNIDATDQCGFHGTGDQINTDPQLGPLAANGGPTETMLPAPGGPAIDKSTSFGVGTDQRGVARPISFPSIADAVGGDGSDVGAVEVQPVGSVKIGKVSKNKKKGTATVTVTPAAPALGTLLLKGKGLKTQKATIGSKATYKLKLIAKGGKAKTLRKKGALKIKFEVTYSPSGVTPVKKKGSTKLIRATKRHGTKGHKSH